MEDMSLSMVVEEYGILHLLEGALLGVTLGFLVVVKTIEVTMSPPYQGTRDPRIQNATWDNWVLCNIES